MLGVEVMSGLAANSKTGPQPENIEKWDAVQLTDYLKGQNVPIGAKFIENKIGGDVISLLTDEDYVRMGYYTCIGDALRVKAAVNALQKTARSVKRNKVVWEGAEYQEFNCFKPLLQCLGCSDVLDQYKLSNSSLQVKSTLAPTCCGLVLQKSGLCCPVGCFHCLCGVTYGKPCLNFSSFLSPLKIYHNRH